MYMGTLSEKEKQKIAGRARTLQERLDTPCQSGETISEIDDMIDEWRDHVASGDSDVFRKRLSREDFSIKECRRRIASNEWPSDEPLPDWIDQLDEILTFAFENRFVEVGFKTEEEIPFVHLLSPFLQYAHEEIDEVPTDYVTRSAVDDLTKWLAHQLSSLCSHTFFIEFKTFVAHRDPDFAFGDDIEPKANPSEYYDDFVEQMLRGELTSFFVEYSFLARLFVRLLRQWVTATEEFYVRVTDDWTEIRDTFVDERSSGKITDIKPLGDMHHDGRTVFGLTYSSGTQVAYKPRNVGIVTGFYDFLEWVNRNGNLPEFRTLDLLSRDDYAWMEWVQSEECAAKEEVDTYYRRAGMLICLFYALNSSDMHFENIIAEGSQPIAIDLETLAQPNIDSEMRSTNKSMDAMIDSVLRTGTVPEHHPSAEVGATAGFAAQEVTFTTEVQEFTNVNTDLMELEYSTENVLEGENLPQYDGKVKKPRENAASITRGFREMYEFIVDNKRAILDDDGPIEHLTAAESRIRVLYRPTSIYSAILNSLTSRSYHQTGVKFGSRVEILAKLMVSDAVDEEVWSIYECERSVLQRLNVPRFTAEIDDDDLYYEGETIVKDFFDQQPITQVRDRIEQFDESDLEEQLDYVKWGYEGYEGSHTNAGETEPITEPFGQQTGFERVTEDTARGVFDRIVANSRIENGSPTWILHELGPDGGLYVHSIEDNLYDGRVGIGVFAAGLARTFDDDRYREFVAEVVSPVVEGIEDEETSERPSGGAVGLGSLVYGFTKIGQLLQDDQYIRAAERCARSVGGGEVSDGTRYDVLRGGAGTVLGLLALYDATGDRNVLNRAVRVGEHLLANRSEHDGIPAWCSSDFERPLCGFSHGVAGIAYALFRLGEATGESRFASAALESIEYERERYDERAQNWPDLRANTEGKWVDAWCHGRTGIGLARLGMYEIDPNPAIRRDVDRALQGIDPQTVSAHDHVCCGNFGRVEFLLRASRSLGEPGYRDEARRLASASVRRSETAEQFSTQWQTNHWYNPSFFSGEAGIGYSMLRFVDQSLPSVLLWE